VAGASIRPIEEAPEPGDRAQVTVGAQTSAVGVDQYGRPWAEVLSQQNEAIIELLGEIRDALRAR